MNLTLSFFALLASLAVTSPAEAQGAGTSGGARQTQTYDCAFSIVFPATPGIPADLREGLRNECDFSDVQADCIIAGINGFGLTRQLVWGCVNEN